jgi:histidyl-tRNA synthetase
MSEKTPVVRGLRDIYPGESERFDMVEQSMIEIIRKYGYQEIRLPVLEAIDLFSRGLGEATDAVEKEMYTLEDRDHDVLALRPEGTASCVRAVIDRNMTREGKPRLWYAGPMFRYERPQKGRYRQFYQIGAEAFGLEGPDVDAELIFMGHDIWKMLGLESAVELEMNTIGSGDSRRAYSEALVKYLNPRKKELDVDSERRLTTNPLRILDSKNSSTQKLLESAKAKLLQRRSERPPLGRDEKILTSWNGLAIKGMAKAAMRFNKKPWLHSSQRAVDFIRDNCFDGNRLAAVWNNGIVGHDGFLDDYANLLDG